MYLTAQRVRSTHGGGGINTYLFAHGTRPVPGMSWHHPDATLVAERHPGDLLVQRIEHDGGGNDVLSFLDVAGADTLGVHGLKAAITAARFDAARGTTWAAGEVAFRFFASPSRVLGAEEEFNQLRDRALLLLRESPARHAPVVGGAELGLVFSDDPGVGVKYGLSPADERRVRAENPAYVPAQILVEYADRARLVALWGVEEFHRQVCLAITGLRDEQLDRVGGLRVVDQHGVLAPGIHARTERLDGQIDGDWFAPDAPRVPRSGWPTGALLRYGDLALDLVYVERAWLALSVRARYTYSHTIGLFEGQEWFFVVRGADRVFRVSLAEPLGRDAVADIYGADAAQRCRPDASIIQLRLTEEAR